MKAKHAPRSAANFVAFSALTSVRSREVLR